jgi:6-phosphogluconolactonase/glucosamine-6-phosphate isomerase/deaminase
MATAHQLIVVADQDALAKAAFERLTARIAANDGRIAICLAGGSSPKKLHELLATDDPRAGIPWGRIHWFIGDERFVRSNNPLNNMVMARRIVLERRAPAPNIHPIPTDVASPNVAAARYEQELKGRYP